MNWLIVKPRSEIGHVNKPLQTKHFIKETDRPQLTSDTAVDDSDLLLNGHGHVLALLEQLSQSDTSVEQLLSGSVQVGAELGKSGDLTVLGQLQFHGTSDLSCREHRKLSQSGSVNNCKETLVNYFQRVRQDLIVPCPVWTRNYQVLLFVSKY